MEPDALTAWIPIGDISPIGGGLMYLEDSVPLGTEIENLFKKVNEDLPEEAQLDAFNENVSQDFAFQLTLDADGRRTHDRQQDVRLEYAAALARGRLPGGRCRLPPLLPGPLQREQ